MDKKSIIKKFYKLFISILLIFTFFGGYGFLQTTKANSIDINNLIKGIDAVDTIKKTDRENFESMVDFFCKAMENQTIDGDNSFKAEESIFLYNICKNKIDFFKIEGFGDDEKKSYIKFKEDSDGNPVNQLTKGLPDFYKDTEDFIQELFDKIIGSYVSVYQANIYGYINDPSKSDFTQHFSKQYFSYGPNNFIDICATDKHYGYPKTCKKLKEYFYAARNLINSNAENILNDENIYKDYEKQKNTITKGLYGGDIDNFINLVYNELMYYGIFVEYYAYLLQNKSEFKNRNVKNFNDKIANNQNRVGEMYDNIDSSRKAIQTSIKMLKEIQYTFPIHIGFLMYSEDIYKFVGNMNKTLTPIYTLQDIFRNVQNPKN